MKKTVRTYDVYFVTRHKARQKWEIYAHDAFNARCIVEEMNPGSKVDRIHLHSESDW